MSKRANATRYPYVWIDVRVDEVDEASAELFEVGAGGVEERDADTMQKAKAPGTVLVIGSFDAEAVARRAARALPKRWNPRVQFVVGDAWREGWRAYFKPSRVGKRFVVRPPWEAVTPQRGDLVLTIEPAQAFGTGTHETTRLVLAEVDRRIRGGESVLDVGCGSGILAIGALLRGAKRARCIDNDPDAVRAAVDNAVLNGVARAIQASTTPVGRVRAKFDMVLANIEARILVPLAPAIGGTVRGGGTLVLSGILRGQEREVLSAYPGFRRLAMPRENDLVAIVLRKEG